MYLRFFIRFLFFATIFTVFYSFTFIDLPSRKTNIPLRCNQLLNISDSDFVATEFFYKVKKKDRVHIFAIDLTNARDTIILDTAYRSKTLINFLPSSIFCSDCRHLFFDIKINKEHYSKEIIIY